MLSFVQGILALLAVICAFSLFSMKCPGGDKAMSGMANAAVCTFLVEAIFKYILGDFAGIAFFEACGAAAGSMGGSAAALLVGIAMGTNPVFAAATAVAVCNFGILPGFIVGYVMHWVLRFLERHLPSGIDVIVCALAGAAGAYGIAYIVNPGVTAAISVIGGAIEAATSYSPLLMGFILGGLMKIICTSPLSSMALTAMLGLTGLPMGIAAVACVGGAFGNGVIFSRLHFGDRGKVIAVMLEPLTQADIITRNPVPIYGSCFISGSLAGITAAYFGIINNAPGTASPIPGLLAPFAFNPPLKVVLCMAIAIVLGAVGGFIASLIFKRFAVMPDDAGSAKKEA